MFFSSVSATSEPEIVVEPQPPFGSSYIPMASASDEVRDYIWSTVIRLAMKLDYSEYATALQWGVYRLTRRNLLLVSKSFHVRLHLYMTGIFDSLICAAYRTATSLYGSDTLKEFRN